MLPKWFISVQEHEKSNCCAEKKKSKTIIYLLVFALSWSYCPDSVCQATKGHSETVFSDNRLQIQEISPIFCHQIKQKQTLTLREVTRIGTPQLVSLSFIHPNLEQVS